MKTAEDIAIIGWQVRFPGADSVEEFWQNLRNGVESIRRSTEAEMVEAGYAAQVVRNPNWVGASPVLDDVEMFDAAFFGFSPRDAEIVDPQIRVFIELAWSALEDAGYDADRYPGRVGVFAGANISRYYLDSLKPLIESQAPGGANTVMTLCFNDKDALSTLVAYKLNLRGPAVTVQTFCSTSLVAVHMACQSLQLGDSDMVIAGGSNLHARGAAGYEYREGDILSPDGHCRPFDERGRGTLFGSGAGAVVLKRLKDALADGDTIHAVIKGSAVNNDGSVKAGYTAPSIEGQSAAVARALEAADVDPRTIGYVEAHGTATEVGDPIEVAALTKAYREKTDGVQYCAIGSVKSNFGHLDRAAGMSSLVKAALAVKHGQIPPTVNFERPNPKIDFESSPFFVNSSLIDWTNDAAGPRRAGVSGLGFGGTNAHVIVEQAPVPEPVGASREHQLLILSARTETALATASQRLAKHLQKRTDQALADVAHTLRLGRRAFPYRQAVVAASAEAAISALEAGGTGAVLGREMVSARRDVVFMFPGQGAQYPGMGRGLYETEPVFKAAVDECADLLTEHLGLDLRDALYPAVEDGEAAERLKQTALTQPALFVVEYATARLLGSWGVRPSGMIGHSVGEWVAACLAGVLPLRDALALVALRGRLMQRCAPGAMLAVMADEAVAVRHAQDGVSLAAVNAPGLCVLAGPFERVDAVEAALRAEGVESRRLETSHAFHSAMMDPALEEFAAAVGRVKLRAPQVPFVSNLTGTWIEASAATDPGYWVRHLREAVRFAEGLRTVAGEDAALVEVGPGRTLGTFARRAGLADRTILATLRPARETAPDAAFLLKAVAEAWVAGVEVDWSRFAADETRRRVALPTYPFERARFWLQPERRTQALPAAPAGKQADVADWFSAPAWKPAAVPQVDLAARVDGRPWLLLGDDGPFLRSLESTLAGLHQPVVRAVIDRGWAREADGSYRVEAGRAEDVAALFDDLQQRSLLPGYVVHTGNLVAPDAPEVALEGVDAAQDRAFFSVVSVLQELGKRRHAKPVHVAVVSNGLHDVVGETVLRPERATLLGPCRVAGRESAEVRTANVDLARGGATEPRAVERVLAEVLDGGASVVAYRGDARWTPAYERAPLAPADPSALPLKAGGVYLVTGGTGGIGLAVAADLTKRYQAKVVLVSRTGLPEPAAWDAWLASHDAADATSRRIAQVRAMQADGEVLVARADVASRDDMQRVIAEAERRWGRIDGVFHTAGVPGGGVIQLKKRDVASRVLEPKVRGTLVLDELLRGRGVAFVALFSSVAAVAGPLGQVDYCAANSFLDTFATARNGRDGTLWTSVAWDDWAEVGMAVETSHRLGVANAGVLQAHTEELRHPHFCRRERAAGELRYVARLSESSGWLLAEHRLFGVPTVPGSAYLEYVRSAFEAETGDVPCELKDIFLSRPLSLAPGETREMSVVLRPNAAGAFDFAVESRGPSGDLQHHVQGAVGAFTPSGNRFDVAELEEACPDHRLDAAFLRQVRDDAPASLVLGSRWLNVTRVQYGDHKILGFHELPPEQRGDVEVFKLHPAYTDFTAVYPLYTTATQGQYVPFSYRSVRVSAPLPPRVISWVRVKDDNTGGRTMRFDCRFLDESGRELLEIEELTLARMDALPAAKGAAAAAPAPAPKDSFTIGIGTPGVLETLAPRPIPRRAPAAGEVEIEVAAAGLNFRDVLRALGMLAAEHDAGESVVGFGAECAGRICAVGAGVTDLAVGDEVLAFATRSFSSHVTSSARAVARIPPGLSFTEAASIPMVFLTAHHALARLARVEAGERVLVHAAAGGVGLAALQVARHLGAEIYASVGSPEKRAYVESLGVRHVTTSRSVSFADDVRSWTGGAGVDVVLNALAGEFITAGLGVLRTGGRFVEIGARDIYADMPLGLRPFARGLSFSAFDLGQVAASKPDYLKTLLHEVLDLLQRGVYRPLPVETYAAADAAAAFRHMAAARHIGKIVISVADLPRQAAPASAPAAAAGQASVSGRDLSHGILPHEGVDALYRALAARRPHLVVATRRVEDFGNPAPARAEAAAARPAAQARKLHPRPSLTTPFREPATPEEEALAKLWRELLGLDRVGVNDSFFDLGGDSLLGIQLIAMIKALDPAYADSITPASLYEGPTVAELARKVAGKASLELAPAGTTALTPEERRARREQRRGRGNA